MFGLRSIRNQTNRSQRAWTLRIDAETLVSGAANVSSCLAVRGRRTSVAPSVSDYEEDILRSLRRITRAIDLHSRKLANTFGLTGPQLICLRALNEVEVCSPKVLANTVYLSPATITGIMDRLVMRQLVRRERSTSDRRQVVLTLTKAGRALVEQAPSPLQARFVSRLENLDDEERQRLRASLDRIVELMDGDDLEAAAVLSTSPSAQSSEEADAIAQQPGPPSPPSEVSPIIDIPE